MKKILLCAVALMFTATLSAQPSEKLKKLEASVKASVERMVKLETLKRGKDCGLHNVDELANESETAAGEANAISLTLQKIVFNAINGVAAIPATDELTDLLTRIFNEGEAVKKASERIDPARKEVEAIKKDKMKAVKVLPAATKSLNNSCEKLQILGEETVEQGKIIADLIELSKE